RGGRTGGSSLGSSGGREGVTDAFGLATHPTKWLPRSRPGGGLIAGTLQCDQPPGEVVQQPAGRATEEVRVLEVALVVEEALGKLEDHLAADRRHLELACALAQLLHRARPARPAAVTDEGDGLAVPLRVHG